MEPYQVAIVLKPIAFLLLMAGVVIPMVTMVGAVSLYIHLRG